MTTPSLETIVSLAKRRGFIFQGSEIFGGLAGTWDYGPLGVELKRNIMNLWWRMFVDERQDMYGVDAAILMNPKTWKASGHVDTFTDPLVECSNCKSRYRTDHLIVDHGEEWLKAIQDNKVDENRSDQQDFLNDKVPCPKCGSKSWGESRQFNMMFRTNVGPVEDENSTSYLRPETAQGIFTNYKNIVDTFYPDIPFGIAQVGKAFRNEISPRDFVFRSREFEQMEIEYFIREEEWEAQFEAWRESIWKFLDLLGLPKDMVHERDVPEGDLAHYSKRTIDFEFDYPHGQDELLGLAYRTDFDLSNVQRASGKNMAYRPKDDGDPFVPHVIEPSFGVERAVMAVLAAAYQEDEADGEQRVLLALPERLAPVKYAVSPLLKNKPELVEKAQTVFDGLKAKHGNVMWDDNGNIGKRYRRQDEIGTPRCVTIDFDTLKDDTVTVRDRDTMAQKRVKISELLAQ
jgi:glycyl-tRNA synthetase